jgi:hypothetical protein
MVATFISFVVAAFVAVASALVAGSAALFWASAGVAAVMLPAITTMVENRILIPPVAVADSFDRSGMVTVVGMLSANAEQSNKSEQSYDVENEFIGIAARKPAHGFGANSAAGIVIRPLSRRRADHGGCQEQRDYHACTHRRLLYVERLWS